MRARRVVARIKKHVRRGRPREGADRFRVGIQRPNRLSAGGVYTPAHLYSVPHCQPIHRSHVVAAVVSYVLAFISAFRISISRFAVASVCVFLFL